MDGVFGTSELARLGDALASWRDGFDDTEHAQERALVAALGGRADGVQDAFSHLRSFVTVQRGCSYYCTFCIVPHVRGRFDHRPMADVLAEVRAAIDAGAREITLVGQTVNAYREPSSGADFADLLEEVAALDGLERLTFVTSHPKDYTEKLARTMGSLEKLNPRFHLPVQSGSDPVLRRMNRKYTVGQYLEKVATFREYCPDWALTTDLITGFPGETEDDFELTLDLCRRVGFAQAFMFVYSPRRGTPAARWEQVPADVGAERLRRLIAVVDGGMRPLHERKIGTTVRCLVQGPSRKDPAKIAAKTLDNVTVVAPMDGVPADRFARSPWIDVVVERGFVWGCEGRISSWSQRFADAGEALPAERSYDLVSSSDVLAALRTVLRAEGASSGRDSARARRRFLRGLRRRCGDDRAPAVDRADLEGCRRRAGRDGRGAASRARRLLGQTRRAPADRRTGGADGGAGPQPAHAARRRPHRHAGDVIEEHLLDRTRNNYLAGVAAVGDAIAVAHADVSTGRCAATAYGGPSALDEALAEIARLEPVEIVADAPTEVRDAIAGAAPEVRVTASALAAVETRERSGVDGFSLDESLAMHRALDAVGSFVRRVGVGGQASPLRAPEFYRARTFLALDAHARKHLELTKALGANPKATLLHTIDRCETAMGSRLLARWILAPLVDREGIELRGGRVATLVGDYPARAQLQELMRGAFDLERLAQKVRFRKASPRDLASLRRTLSLIEPLRAALPAPLASLGERIADLREPLERLERTLVDEPPATLGDGGVIRPEASDDVRECVALRTEARDRICGARGARAAAHRHQAAQGEVRQRVRLFDRGEQEQPRRGAAGLRPQADPHQRRALRHARTQRTGDRHLERADAPIAARGGALRRTRRGARAARRRRARQRRGHRRTGRLLFARAGRGRARLRPARVRRREPHRRRRRPSPGHGGVARRRVRAQRPAPRARIATVSYC